MKEDCDNALRSQVDSSIPQEFMSAIIACSIASFLMGKIFDNAIEAHENTWGNLEMWGRLGPFIMMVSGHLRHSIGLQREVDRLMKKEWKKNRKIIRKMESTYANKLDGVLLDAYNDLHSGDEQMSAVVAWQRASNQRARAADRRQFVKMAKIVGFGTVGLVGAFTLMAGSAMQGFGSRPNPGNVTVTKTYDSMGNLINQRED